MTSKNRVIMAAALVVIAVGAGIGGTIAFYNDTETSQANVLTAGAVDLKVDHTRQVYNGVDCKTCKVELVSDETVFVEERNKNAEIYTPTNVTNSAWTATGINNPNAEWIWAHSTVLQNDVVNGATYTFVKEFTWYGPTTGATINFAVAADNSYQVYFNGVMIAQDTNENNFAVADTINLLPADIDQGNNTLEIKVTNAPRPSGNTNSNPAGLKFSLVINGDCEDSYFAKHCTLFGEKDLGKGDKFWNFDDVKPGDLGINVISLHARNNDAFACLVVHEVENDENYVVEPEGNDDEEEGELSSYIDLFLWNDLNGNGVYEPAVESDLYLGDFDSAMMSSPVTLPGNGNAGYVGVAWCAGDIEVNDTTGVITCDSNGMLNDAQTDQLTASLTAYAEQVRNNSSFTCEGLNEELDGEDRIVE